MLGKLVQVRLNLVTLGQDIVDVPHVAHPPFLRRNRTLHLRIVGPHLKKDHEVFIDGMGCRTSEDLLSEVVLNEELFLLGSRNLDLGILFFRQDVKCLVVEITKNDLPVILTPLLLVGEPLQDKLQSLGRVEGR